MKQVQGTSLVELLVSLLILSFSTLPLLIAQWRVLQSMHELERSSHVLLMMNNLSEHLLNGDPVDQGKWMSLLTTTVPGSEAQLSQRTTGAVILALRWPRLGQRKVNCQQWPRSGFHCLNRSL